MAKRMFDLMVATAMLLAATPLLLVAVLAIRIDSPGPAGFRQERVGRGGRVFRIHKLRTMHVDASALGPVVTAHEDVRVTRVGRLLRRYRIDELPQLIDVIKGDMSLVGPRPEVPRFVAVYPALLRDELLAVRPGLTDPAALEFADETRLLANAADPERAYIECILPHKLELQVAYLRRATLYTDLVVLGRTLKLLLVR